MVTMCASAARALDRVNEASSVKVDVELRRASGEAISAKIDVVKWWVAKTRSEEVVFGPFEIADSDASFSIVIGKDAHICAGKRVEGRSLVVYAETGYDNRKHFVFNYEVQPLPSVPLSGVEEEG